MRPRSRRLRRSPAKGYDPNRYLMLLEFPDGREPRAAVAVGNPDTAEHVSQASLKITARWMVKLMTVAVPCAMTNAMTTPIAE
ncbi:hypothetical protein MDOR_35130 [Mycolicibacterium doricum]|uniref:Uncharacterized protein n=1 Tax=Mycolicibacterium doricum TaxID=126673 RepID=A0A7I7VVM2_9MYCO|nr:hypothetical protein MDOR_35130 [Mycolicibacterium doricum]